MMTIVTHVHLKEGAGREWGDARRLGGLAPGPAIRTDAPAARRVGERADRALVA